MTREPSAIDDEMVTKTGIGTTREGSHAVLSPYYPQGPRAGDEPASWAPEPERTADMLPPPFAPESTPLYDALLAEQPIRGLDGP